MAPKKPIWKTTFFQRAAIFFTRKWNILRLTGSAVILLAILLYVYQPLETARARIHIRSSAISFTVDSMSYERERFNFALSSNDTVPIILQSAMPLNTSGFLMHHLPYTVRPIDSPPVVKIERLHFPNSAEVELEQDMNQSLKMNIMAAENHQGDSIYFKFAVSYAAGLLFNYTTNRYDTINKGNTSFSRSFVEFQNNLSSGHSHTLFFFKPGNWEWPKTLYISRLFFNTNNLTKTRPVSAIINGTIKITDTDDEPIDIRQGNSIKLQLNRPAELILKGDSSGLTVQLDAELTGLMIGDEINGAYNYMPDRIKWLHRKFGYSWSIFTFILTLFPFILPGKKKEK